MLDIKRIRLEKDEVIEALKKRRKEYPIEEVLKADEKRRNLLTEVEKKKELQNKVSKEIPKLKKEGKDISETLKEMKELSAEIESGDREISEVVEGLKNLLLQIPNTPDESVPDGASDEDNKEIRKFMEPTKFSFEPKAHWDLGVDLDILDFERATKIAGSRFSIFKGKEQD